MKKKLKILASPVLMAFCLIFTAVSLATATFIESSHGTDIARKAVYNARWFEILLLLGSINLLASILVRKLYRPEKFSIFIFHLALIVIIIGAGLTRYLGIEGTMHIREGESSDFILLDNGTKHKLPFSLHLNDFIVEYYTGSNNPSGYESRVVLYDVEKNIEENRLIYMNKVLIHRGYRFFQSSYHNDLKGTILSVSKDGAGTFVTYAGYFLLTLGMAWSLINRHSRFYSLVGPKSALTIFIIAVATSAAHAQVHDTIPVIPAAHAEKFGSILVLDNQGRIKPLSTLSGDIFRKINRKTSFQNQSAGQVLLGALVYPEKWHNVQMVYAGSLAAESIGLKGKRASLLECYKGKGIFVSSHGAYEASMKKPSARSKSENAIIRFDERLNILYHWFMGNMLNIFPTPNDTGGKWLNPVEVSGKVLTADSVFVENIFAAYIEELKKSVVSGNWDTPDSLVAAIKNYQRKMALNLPSEKKVKVEQWYYKTDYFNYIFYAYFTFGFLILVLQLINVFTAKKRFVVLVNVFSGAVAGAFILHTSLLVVRWYVSGHAPWSNSYESMLFVAWAVVLAGLIFLKRNAMATAVAALMASIFLMAAHMSWMDPQITNLVPVLQSVWLIIHVAVITASYGFLGTASILAFFNLLIMALHSKSKSKPIAASTAQLSRIIEIAIISGTYMLTIGTFPGAVWANISWGRYWGWDPKETWSLITIIVYALVLHIRLIKGLGGKVLFNSLAMFSYAFVLMTYIGVNYYLTGLHSYASGEPAPVPAAVFYSLSALVLVVAGAALNSWRIAKS
ncbi:MAG: cytochrome c biogenesis protein CcsA [Bacteroidales bacterium]|nr:cytochrome c biogenesis protein CcsA [Bacteroidales bacterium]